MRISFCISAFLFSICVKAFPKCDSTENSFIDYDSDCKEYYICQLGQLQKKVCPDKQRFDQVSGNCEWEELVKDCAVQLSPLCPKRNGLFVKPGSFCQSYYNCKNGNAKEISCLDGELFDQESERCEWKEIVKCLDKDVSCPVSDGTFLKNGSKCKSYIVCKRGKAQHFTCPDDWLFSTQTKRCDWPELVDCNDEQKKTSPDIFTTRHRDLTMTPRTKSSDTVTTSEALRTTHDTSHPTLSTISVITPMEISKMPETKSPRVSIIHRTTSSYKLTSSQILSTMFQSTPSNMSIIAGSTISIKPTLPTKVLSTDTFQTVPLKTLATPSTISPDIIFENKTTLAISSSSLKTVSGTKFSTSRTTDPNVITSPTINATSIIDVSITSNKTSFTDVRTPKETPIALTVHLKTEKTLVVPKTSIENTMTMYPHLTETTIFETSFPNVSTTLQTTLSNESGYPSESFTTLPLTTKNVIQTTSEIKSKSSTANSTLWTTLTHTTTPRGCVFGDDACQPDPVLCPEEFGEFAHPDVPTIFVHCDHWRPYIKECPDDLHFDPKEKVCDWPK